MAVHERIGTRRAAIGAEPSPIRNRRWRCTRTVAVAAAVELAATLSRLPLQRPATVVAGKN